MAIDNNVLIHQMTTKGKRLTSGLERFVATMTAIYEESAANGNVPTPEMLTKEHNAVKQAYFYALGCLGGDYLTKRLVRTAALKDVVEDLRSQKLIKDEKADKLIAEWEKRREKAAAKAEKERAKAARAASVATEKDGVESVNAAEESVVEGAGANPERPEELPVADAVDAMAVDGSEKVDASDKEACNGSAKAVAADPTEFVVTFDYAKKIATPTGVPDTLRTIYDYLMESWEVTKRFATSISRNGIRWERRETTKIGNDLYTIRYVKAYD